MKWTVCQYEDSPWRIYDPTGQERGRFATAQIMAEHLAMVMEENDRMRRQLATLTEAALAANVALFERWPDDRVVPVACHLNKVLIEQREERAK